jgi:ribosomal protein S18 acetylase RimI-like enzyme
MQQRGETPGDIIIREVTINDIPALAALHVRTWNETHGAGKHSPTTALREQQWRQQFKIKDGSWCCFIAINKQGQLVGFAKGNSYASPELPGYAGELNKIYLLLPYQRLGIGRQLMRHVAQRFVSRGITSMALFSTPQNPSCAFYSALKGEKLYAKNGAFHGGYGWKNIAVLIDHFAIA